MIFVFFSYNEREYDLQNCFLWKLVFWFWEIVTLSVLQFRGEDGIRKKMDAHYFSTLSTSWTFWTPVAFILYTGKILLKNSKLKSLLHYVTSDQRKWWRKRLEVTCLNQGVLAGPSMIHYRCRSDHLDAVLPAVFPETAPSSILFRISKKSFHYIFVFYLLNQCHYYGVLICHGKPI